MKKDIEKTFFKAFQNGGVVDDCIRILRERYDLGIYPKSMPEQGKNQKEISEDWRRYYEITLPNKINKETEDFDDSVIRGYPSLIIEEIEENLKECKTNSETDRYIFLLLKPFKGLSDIFHPVASIKRLERNIEECKESILKWKQSNYEHAKKQIEACERSIETDAKNIERIHYINRRFCEISSEEVHEEGTVEGCLIAFLNVADMFANQLDALLLTYGIDLIRLQNESGIYLKNYRSITDVDYYIGSLELAQKYIDELNKAKPVSSEVNSDNSTQRTIIPDLCYLHLFEKFKEIFPSETKESWTIRFVDDPEHLEPLIIGNNIADIVGMLDAIHEVNKGYNPDKFSDYVDRRWGIKNLSRKKGDHKNKRNYQDAKKNSEVILKSHSRYSSYQK